MRTFRALVVVHLVALTFASDVATAKASPVAACSEYYHFLKRKLSYDLNPLLKLRHAVLRTGIGDNVTEGKSLPGKFGGSRRVFNKKDPNQPWERYIGTPGFNDVIVNPDSLIRILGTENAKKLGFELSPTSAIVPDVTELRAAIANFNRQFPEGDERRLSINFYETGNKPLTGEEYRDRFLNENELPMAKSGRLQFHDFTAHAGSAFMPKEIVEETKLRFGVFAGFESYLKKADPGLSRLVADLYRKRLDNLIDTRSNKGQNNLVETASGNKRLYLQMHHLSANSYAVRASDDASEALLEILQYVELRPERAELLRQYVQSYMKEQVLRNPELSNFPFGLKPAEGSEAQVEQVQAHTAELISRRLQQLRNAFREWNP